MLSGLCLFATEMSCLVNKSKQLNCLPSTEKGKFINQSRTDAILFHCGFFREEFIDCLKIKGEVVAVRKVLFVSFVYIGSHDKSTSFRSPVKSKMN